MSSRRKSVLELSQAFPRSSPEGWSEWVWPPVPLLGHYTHPFFRDSVSFLSILGPYVGLASPHLSASHLLRGTGPSAPLPWSPIKAAAPQGIHTPKLCSDFKSCRPKAQLLPSPGTQEPALPTSKVPLGFQVLGVLQAQLLSAISDSLPSWGPKHRLFN